MPTVISSSWSGARPSSKTRLLNKVLRLYGMDAADADLRQAALDCLDDAVNDLNSSLYEFNRVTESGISLSTEQQWITLNSQFYKESQCYLNRTGQGDNTPMLYMDWVQFKRLYPENTTLGRPSIYTIFNSDQDGRLYLYDSPDQTTVDNYTLSVEYYRRIPLVSSLGNEGSLNVPREIENALIYGAQKQLSSVVMGPGHPDVRALAGLESEAIARLKQSDRLHPDVQLRFKLAERAYNPWRR